jgi:hypothetical protein
MDDLQSYKEGDDVIVVLDLDNDDVGVYPTLSRAMDYIADFMAAASNDDEADKDYEIRRENIREDETKALETTYGWVIECQDRSFKAFKSALRK